MTKCWLNDFYIKDHNKKFFSWKRAKCQVSQALDMIITLASIMRPGSPSSECVRRIWMRHRIIVYTWNHSIWNEAYYVALKHLSAVARWPRVKSLASEGCVSASEQAQDIYYIWKSVSVILIHKCEAQRQTSIGIQGIVYLKIKNLS